MIFFCRHKHLEPVQKTLTNRLRYNLLKCLFELWPLKKMVPSGSYNGQN